MNKGNLVAIVLAISVTGSGCSIIESSGRLGRTAGEAMEEYSEENEGVMSRMIGVAGSIHTSVGGAVENAAKRERKDSDKNKAEGESK